MAAGVVFGSRARGSGRPDSDLDLGVLLVERDPHRRLLERGRLAASLSDLAVDVVDLDDAPALLAHRALKGRRLMVRDQRRWVRFVARTLARAGDEQYWRERDARARGRRLAEGRFGRP